MYHSFFSNREEGLQSQKDEEMFIKALVNQYDPDCLEELMNIFELKYEKEYPDICLQLKYQKKLEINLFPFCTKAH